MVSEIYRDRKTVSANGGEQTILVSLHCKPSLGNSTLRVAVLEITRLTLLFSNQSGAMTSAVCFDDEMDHGMRLHVSIVNTCVG